MSRIQFQTIYAAETANPYMTDATYRSVLPSLELAPYIRCFWGSEEDFDPGSSAIYGNTLIVPDTCFDLMLVKDNEKGSYRIIFVGMSSAYSIDQWREDERKMSLFAIRFPFWAMHLIGNFHFKDTMDQILPAEEFFPAISQLCEQIFDQPAFIGRVRLAEQYIEKMIDDRKLNAPFLNGIELMLKQKGNVTLEDLSRYSGYSHRQTQRIFREVTGASPKQMADLVRYQSLWQEMLQSGGLNYQDLVHKYGYTDQSHMISVFKKYHSMTPREALKSILK